MTDYQRVQGPSGIDGDRNGETDAEIAGSDIRAAIDMGTNSFHLVVARCDASGGFDVVTTEKESVRLGEGSGDMTELSAEAIERGVATLKRFRSIADSYGADIAAVATSAVREAENRDVFLDRVRDEAGIEVEVIPGTEEARLIHLGVLQALPVFDNQILTIDIGGGSTEFVVGRAARILASRSVRLGHIRLTDRFFPGGICEPSALDEARQFVRAFLAPVGAALGPLGHQMVAGSSGTISALAHMGSIRTRRSTGNPTDKATLYAEELRELVEHLASFRTPAERQSATRGLEERRADVIVGGAVLLEQIFETFEIAKLRVSDYALREGVLLDRVHGDTGGFHHLNDIRRDSVLRFADAFEEDRSHVEHATDLSLQIFDGLTELHGYGLFERDLLEAAGLLHNVGLFVSHAAHHKHSYYIIRNSDRLLGFSDREIELIAQVARYHRRSAPKATHDAWMSLDEADRQRVSVLGGILRLAIALDRTRSRAITAVGVAASDEHIELSVERAEGADSSLELYTADERSAMLANATGRTVNVS